MSDHDAVNSKPRSRFCEGVFFLPFRIVLNYFLFCYNGYEKIIVFLIGVDMRVFIDADGCPVIDIAISISTDLAVECILVCDTSHFFHKDGVKTITVSKGPDSVDFALVNMLMKGDLVITQDYGLAAMCLARKGLPISQNGLVYNDSNIDSLLEARNMSRKIRNSGGRIKGPGKRSPEQDEAFSFAFRKLLTEQIASA